jgi:hypothetical protein
MLSAFGLHGFFGVNRLVDLAIIFTFGEYVFLGWRARWRRKAMIDLLFALAPGVCLMFAIRAALLGSGLLWVVAFLSASLPLHLADLARRTR